jgi:hypothetical protein
MPRQPASVDSDGAHLSLGFTLTANLVVGAGLTRVTVLNGSWIARTAHTSQYPLPICNSGLQCGGQSIHPSTMAHS